MKATAAVVLCTGSLLGTGVLNPGLVGLSTASAQRSAIVQAAAKPGSEQRAYPDVSVYDAATGQKFNLAALAGDRRTTLVWFWAPH